MNTNYRARICKNKYCRGRSRTLFDGGGWRGRSERSSAVLRRRFFANQIESAYKFNSKRLQSQRRSIDVCSHDGENKLRDAKQCSPGANSARSSVRRLHPSTCTPGRSVAGQLQSVRSRLYTSERVGAILQIVRSSTRSACWLPFDCLHRPLLKSPTYTVRDIQFQPDP